MWDRFGSEEVNHRGMQGTWPRTLSVLAALVGFLAVVLQGPVVQAAATGAKSDPGVDLTIDDLGGRTGALGPKAMDRSGGRIVGGRPADLEDWRFFGSLTESGSPYCGGAVIADGWVATAAHCVEFEGETAVVTGRSNLRDAGLIHPSQDIFIHPRFKGMNLHWDIALIRVPESATLEAIPFASEGSLPAGEASVAGFGRLFEGSSYLSSTLMETDLEVLDNSVCREAYGGAFHPASMLCAAKQGKDSCQGDSGGPLVSDGELIGLVSWGAGCARPGYPGVYSRMSSVSGWVSRVIAGEGEAAVLRETYKGRYKGLSYLYNAFSQPVKGATIRFRHPVRINGRRVSGGRWIRAQREGSWSGIDGLHRAKKRCTNATVRNYLSGGKITTRTKICLPR